MVNIVVAWKVWGPMWRDARIQIHCDNLAVVQVLTSGGSRDPILSSCARNIWLLSALYNITVQFSHIADYSIVYLEMVNIVVAWKVWGPMWRDARIQIHCDNLAVVQVLTSGGSRDPILSSCARNIWLLSALYNITVQFSHIAGVHNTVADLLSRWTNSRQDVKALIAHFLWSIRLPRDYGLPFVLPHWLLIVECLLISWPSWWS